MGLRFMTTKTIIATEFTTFHSQTFSVPQLPLPLKVYTYYHMATVCNMTSGSSQPHMFQAYIGIYMQIFK